MSVTTGSTVEGTVPGLRKHLGGGADLMYVNGDPDSVVFPAQPGDSPSGAVIAYDNDDDQFYRNDTGSTWFKLGSVA